MEDKCKIIGTRYSIKYTPAPKDLEKPKSMKLIIYIPNDEIRACVSCNGGEMNLNLNINETIKGYDVTSVESDTYDGNNPLKYEVKEK